MLRVVLAALLMLVPVPAMAWGAQGHEIVALVALKELTPAARQQVAQLLGSDAMLVHEASWADEVRDARPQTARWHYVNIPLRSSGYLAARDCRSGDCVVAQINAARSRLGNPHLPKAARAEALRFLIHFAGDIHQPLHAADHDDRGGNAIRVILRGERTNMHRIWDADMVQALGRNADRIATDILTRLTPIQRRAIMAGTPDAWANESLGLAKRSIYPMVGDRGTLRLQANYLEAQEPFVRLQLARAGLRLAWLLNSTLR